MELLLNLATKTSIYIIFLLALNSLMVGKTNLWAIGNIVYISLGCFLTGYFSTVLPSPNYLYLMFLLVPVIVALVSLLFFFASRVFKKDFFLFFSLFYIELNFVTNKLVAGSSGYSNIMRPAGLSSNVSLFCIVFILMLALSFMMRRVDRSRLAQLHTIIRNNELLASSWGIDIKKEQLPIFIASAVISGICGIFFAFCTFGADPNLFTTSNIIVLFTLIIFGGIDSVRGSIVAGLFFVLFTYFIEEVLFTQFPVAAPKVAQIVFGLLLVVTPLILPKGLFGKRSLE